VARGDAGRGRRTGGGGDPTERIARAAERLTEKLERQAANLDRHAAEIARKAEVFDRTSEYLAAIDLWMRGLAAERKPRFTHEEVCAAAMRVVDTEGFEALTMRRLAAELEAPTMTLYHYVRTKDELLSLIHDAVMAEVVVPADVEIPADWKQAIALIARRTRDAMLRHPWVTTVSEGPSLGPNSVRHFDQSLQALTGLDQPFAVKLDILMLIDEYVFGYCNQIAESSELEELPEFSEYVTQLIADGSFPQVQAVIAELGLQTLWRTVGDHLVDPERFERNLWRLIDGIEHGLSEAGSPRRATPSL
jgi:AcrR family transcriptional regulator